MIQVKSFENAIPFAAVLAAKGVKAVAAPNTVLSELVRLSTPSFDIKSDQDDSHTQYAQVVASSTYSEHGNMSQHSLSMDGYIADIAKLVNSHISYAKNVVKPVVMHFAEELEAYKATSPCKKADNEFNVIQLRVPAVLKDESFLDTLNYYKDKTAISPKTPFRLDDKSPEELAQLVMTGHGRTDKLIAEWLSHMDENFLHTVWASFYTVSNTPDDHMTYSLIESLNAFAKADASLAMHLLARKLFDDASLGKDMNLTQYKALAAEYRDYSGSVLVNAINKIGLFARAKTLIIENDERMKTIKVNGDLYGDWLEAGGDTAVILGIAVSGATPSSQMAIDDGSVQYKRQWESYCTFFASSEKNKYFSYVKDFIENAFLQSLKTLDATEETFVAKNPNFYNNVRKLLKDELNTMTASDVADHHTLALRLMGKCRFYYTSAFSILNDIQEASRANPNVDVREAALFAAINYVADYLADQISTAP